MRLDGDLVRIDGPSFCGWYAPIDHPVSRDDRAAALRDIVPIGFVVAGMTAAWVHDGLCPGGRITVVATRRRGPLPRRRDLDVRYPQLSERATTAASGLHFTTIARTLADVALDLTCSSARLAALVSVVAESERPAVLDEACAALARRHGGARAARRLRAHARRA